MRRLQSVNLEWHKQEPGLLALGRHCVSDSGQVATALRDNLAPRTYCLMQYTGDSHAGVDAVCGATFTMETVRRVETLAEGGFALAVTDHDLYFMNTSSPIIDRTAYQPGRGMSFVDVALAAHDPRHTFAILSVDRTGENFTLSTAEGGESLVALWSKAWVTPIVSLAISSDGEYIAVGREDGAIILVKSSKKGAVGSTSPTILLPLPRLPLTATARPSRLAPMETYVNMPQLTARSNGVSRLSTRQKRSCRKYYPQPLMLQPIHIAG